MSDRARLLRALLRNDLHMFTQRVFRDLECQIAPNLVPPFALNVSPFGAGVCSRPAA
jgi:hypothetical protein